jgi:hypothetical protein
VLIRISSYSKGDYKSVIALQCYLQRTHWRARIIPCLVDESEECKIKRLEIKIIVREAISSLRGLVSLSSENRNLYPEYINAVWGML